MVAASSARPATYATGDRHEESAETPVIRTCTAAAAVIRHRKVRPATGGAAAHQLGVLALQRPIHPHHLLLIRLQPLHHRPQLQQLTLQPLRHPRQLVGAQAVEGRRWGEGGAGWGDGG